MYQKVIEMKSIKGYTDTQGIKEWNNACDTIPLIRQRGRKRDKNDTVDIKKKKTGKLRDRQT